MNVSLVLVIFAVFAAAIFLGRKAHKEEKAEAEARAKARDNGKKEAVYDDPVEYCIDCRGATQYKKADPVDCREDYVDGAGQLCPSCAEKVFVSL